MESSRGSRSGIKFSPEGVINLYKPPQISSHEAVKQVKSALRVKKAGHAGTLDPLAEGVLLVCTGRATRISEYLMGLQKSYSLRMVLGVRTDTFDREGKIIERRPVSEITPDRVKAVLSEFEGEIEQTPPIYSAIKHNGTPLYKMARMGRKVMLVPRRVVIYRINLIRIEGESITLEVGCSKGTYIRSLVDDIGLRLGTGAVLDYLRRDAVGSFHHEQADRLHEIEKGRFSLIPIQKALEHLKSITVDGETALRLSQGQTAPVGVDLTEPFMVFSEDGRFIGIGKPVGEGRIRMEKVFV